MLVTVAICTYKRPDYLRQTLAGIARQDFPRDQFEVIVIDNNSPDNTAEVVAEFAGENPAPRYVNESRQGLDYSRNRAIAEARGEFLIMADNDILMEPDWISRMIAPLTADTAGRIGALGGEVAPVFPDGLPSWLDDAHTPQGFRSDTGPLSASQSPMGANFAFPRRVFKKHGGFRTDLDRRVPQLFAGGDGEMIRRLRRAGLEIWFVPAAKVLHQIPSSRLNLRYTLRHGFDSARSRVIDRAARPGAKLYFLSRWVINLFIKVPGFALISLLNAIVLRTGPAKRALVRSWRSCGYLFQIIRSLLKMD